MLKQCDFDRIFPNEEEKYPQEIGMSKKHLQSKHSSSTSNSNRGNKNPRRNLVWLWVSLGAIVIIGLGFLLFHPANAPASAGIPTQARLASVEITPAQAYAKYQQGVFFLDVRIQDEWNQFHLAKSTLIPLDQLPSRLNELPKDQDIIVVCLSGHRAQSGVVILQQAGFTRVAYMNGGLQAWIAAGYPVERGTP